MEQNLFGSSALAAGYAASRPPVHPEVIRRFQQHRPTPLYSRALVNGRGEGLPFADRSIHFMTAAGSLNYTDGLQAFFGEARRVLAPENGGILVYDL